MFCCSRNTSGSISVPKCCNIFTETRVAVKNIVWHSFRVRRRCELLQRVNERLGCNQLQLLKSIIMEHNLPSLLSLVTPERYFSTVTGYEMNDWNSIWTKDFYSISTKDFSYLYHATCKWYSDKGSSELWREVESKPPRNSHLKTEKSYPAISSMPSCFGAYQHSNLDMLCHPFSYFVPKYSLDMTTRHLSLVTVD
jgi:hypothetical protein